MRDRAHRFSLGTAALAALGLCVACSASLADEAADDGPPGGDLPFAEQCVKLINDHRATVSLPPLARWEDGEACADDQAETDATANSPHSAFGTCSEGAQNECPAWPGPPENMIGSCLAQMWAEGPGQDFAEHGHYLNMTNTKFTQVACGVSVGSDGKVWAIQNFR